MTEECITVGVPMVGDPKIIDSLGSTMTRRACQYAAAMLEKAGALSGDLSRFDAHCDRVATVTFVAADATQAEAARFTIPARVLAFDPHKPPLRLADLTGSETPSEEEKAWRTA